MMYTANIAAIAAIRANTTATITIVLRLKKEKRGVEPVLGRVS